MNSTDFTLNFEMRGSYLYAYISGQDSFSASLDYWNRIADQVREFNTTRVLVHENLLGQVTEGEMFDIIMDLLPSSTGIRVAFFDENNADQSVNELGELLANNRGVDIRIFQSLEDAEKWIAKED